MCAGSGAASGGLTVREAHSWKKGMRCWAGLSRRSHRKPLTARTGSSATAPLPHPASTAPANLNVIVRMQDTQAVPRPNRGLTVARTQGSQAQGRRHHPQPCPCEASCQVRRAGSHASARPGTPLDGAVRQSLQDTHDSFGRLQRSERMGNLPSCQGRHTCACFAAATPSSPALAAE